MIAFEALDFCLLHQTGFLLDRDTLQLKTEYITIPKIKDTVHVAYIAILH